MILPQIAAMMLAAAVSATAPAAAPEPITDVQVRRAVEKGREWLQAQQKEDGLWRQQTGPMTPGPCGTSALAAKAMLESGSSPTNSAVMVRALDALVAADLKETQAVAGRMIVLARASSVMSAAGPRRNIIRDAIKQDAISLVNAQAASGGWSRGSLGRGEGDGDFVNTVWAVRGLDAASHVGIEIPDAVWRRARDALYKMQQPDGSWIDPQDKTAAGATAAGAECLNILFSELGLTTACPCPQRQPSAEAAEQQRRIDLAMDRLSQVAGRWIRNLATDQEEALGNLCAVGRVARVTGNRSLGGVDWYKEAAEQLVKCQREDGSWGDVPRTALAVEFLYEGRTTPIIAKLRISGARWNSHPQDLAYLSAYITKWLCGTTVDWQVVDIDEPLDVMHETPILFLSLDSVPDLTADQKKKLRAFTDTGGTILLEAVCGNADVRKWAEKFFAEVWPEWKLKALPPDHGLFTDSSYPMKTQRPELMGIDDGLATRVFYSPDDISCAWQTRSVAAKEYLFKFMLNMRYYASDRGLYRTRLSEPDPPSTRYADPAKAGARAKLKIDRVTYDGDGWTVGANYKGLETIKADIARRASVELAVDDRGAAPSDLAGADIAYLTGSSAMAMDEKGQAALKAYTDKGGFLWVEAAGGAAAFDESFRTFAEKAGWVLTPLGKDHPMMTGKFAAAAGYDLTSGVGFHRSLRISRLGRGWADLVGIYQDGRLVGVYSPLDVVFSTTGYPAYGCRGYAQEDAKAVAANILLYVSDRAAKGEGR